MAILKCLIKWGGGLWRGGVHFNFGKCYTLVFLYILTIKTNIY